MEYVVTGGAGYIGGHLVDELAKRGKVMVVDDLSSGHRINKKARMVRYDLRRGCPKLPHGSVIMHLAANPDVRNSMLEPKDHYERDVTATLNVLEAARKADAKMVMFASSSTVYGNAKKMPTPEGCMPNPISNYGLFKLMGEDIVRCYSEMYGIRTASLRFANVVGGRTSHGIIYNFARSFKKGKPVEIWGDGKQSKSYIYITDLIRAMTLLEKRAKRGNDTFNIGNFDATSVNEIFRMFKSTVKRKYSVRHIGNQPGDVRAFLLDVKKLCGYGWKPKYG